MFSKKKWRLISLGAVLLLLSIWGWWGGGTASKLFAEKNAENPKAVETEVSGQDADDVSGEDENKPRLVYDAGSHLRSTPLRDPFHAEAIGKQESARKTQKNKAAASPVKTGETRKAAAGKVESVTGEPVLKGIMMYGKQKRAMLEVDGVTNTLAEGERSGTWTVQEIREKSVVLVSPGGERVLTL